MSLSTLPVELRLQIYEYVPALQSGRHETVAPHLPLTPAISRASKWLREETLPIYARNAHFAIQADEDAYPEGDRVSTWVRALGTAIRHAQSFQLSRHWKLSQPTRWQSHVGFYVRVEVAEGQWRCKAGTYPIAKDTRGMRAEGVQLLGDEIGRIVMQPVSQRQNQRLEAVDVLYIAAAMNVVATHPISVYDSEQSEAGRQRRQKAWSNLEEALHLLTQPSAAPYPPLLLLTSRGMTTP